MDGKTIGDLIAGVGKGIDALLYIIGVLVVLLLVSVPFAIYGLTVFCRWLF